MPRDVQIAFDCADPDRLAQFWAEALGYILQPPPDGFSSWPEFLGSIGVPEEDFGMASAAVDPEGERPRLFFQRVPEGKVAKNRVHLDVRVAARGLEPDEQKKVIDDEVERLSELGATTLRPVAERGEYWVVMQDPEGNEFCVT